MTSVTNNTAKKRYELAIEEHIVFADYRFDGNSIYITHVEAPPALRGTGAAGKLMEGMLNLIRGQGLQVIPVCSYAVAWIERHKEYHNLLN